MARRKVEEKNYDELIEISAERIEALKEELKRAQEERQKYLESLGGVY